MLDLVHWPDRDLATSEARRQRGHDMRRQVPRCSHATWAPPADRRDPVDILVEQDGARLAPLVPLRHARMAADAFAFLRGAAAVMAADLAQTPVTGLLVQACGDAHLENFGAFASPEGTAVFDVNDFDETLPAPWEWDVKRLATSAAVAGRARGLSDKASRALARRAGHAYRRELEELSHLPPLDAWRARIDLAAAIDDVGDRDVRRAERARLHATMEAGRNGWAKLLTREGALRLHENPPVVWRLDAHEDTAHAAFAAYVASQPAERRVLLERYRLRDVAFKAVGVGSVGTFCAIGLFATADGDPLVLQLKEAGRSVLAPFAGASAFAHAGMRVVSGQRTIQATPDEFLGWAEGGPDARQFYVRQFKDGRLAAIGQEIEAAALPFHAKLCGRSLAHAHARSGDAAAISGYLGDGDAFDDALAEFAMLYADQTARDHAAFVRAIQDGRLASADTPAR